MEASTEETRTESDNNGRNVGRIEEIQGVVIEAVFPDDLPEINNAITIERIELLAKSGGKSGLYKAKD